MQAHGYVDMTWGARAAKNNTHFHAFAWVHTQCGVMAIRIRRRHRPRDACISGKLRSLLYRWDNRCFENRPPRTNCGWFWPHPVNFDTDQRESICHRRKMQRRNNRADRCKVVRNLRKHFFFSVSMTAENFARLQNTSKLAVV